MCSTFFNIIFLCKENCGFSPNLRFPKAVVSREHHRHSICFFRGHLFDSDNIERRAMLEAPGDLRDILRNIADISIEMSRAVDGEITELGHRVSTAMPTTLDGWK
jgi:hypothetical protein